MNWTSNQGKMNILQIMGCTSKQYASMEQYLVAKAAFLRANNGRFIVIYENRPVDDRFIQDFEQAGGVLIRDKLKSLADVIYYLRLYLVIRKYQIDIVHNYFTPTCHYVAIFLKLIGYKNVVRSAANMPYIIPQGSDFETFSPKWKLVIRHKFLSYFVKSIICRSTEVSKAFAITGVNPLKIAIADGGCNIEQYKYSQNARIKIRKELTIPDSTILMGVFCRLVSIKRIDRLIRRFAACTKDIDIHLLIAGEGPERQALESLCCELLLEKVSFLGHRKDLAQLYSAIDIFCLSSEAEGMSNSILEAMSTRCPVIVTDIPSNREVVVSGKSGFLISYENDDEFIACLQSLLKAETRSEIGQFNRKRIVENFSLNSRLEKEWFVYKKISKL